MSYGVNANLLRRWVQATERDDAPPEAERPTAFVQLKLDQPRPASLTPAADIRIELRRGSMAVTITWPLAESPACAAWMRELLR